MIRPEHLRELDRLTSLAFDEAIRLQHSFCSAEHFLLALLRSTRDNVRESDPPPREFDPEAGIVLNPKGGQLVARAEGIAVGLGDAVPREEHVLLAYLWDSREEWLLKHCGSSRQEVFERLREQGVTARAVPLPPTHVPPSGRNQRIYVPPERLQGVLSKLHSLLPDESEWGWNVHPETDRAWIAATGDFDLDEIVREALNRSAERASRT
jgi:Clp amino terminal domain, pathogenicity island component